MKLIQQLQSISEAAKEAGVEVKDLFKTAEDDGKLETFQKKKLFDARAAVPDEAVMITAPGKTKKTMKGKDGLWVVRDHDNINVVDLLSDKDFKAKYVQVRANQRADAEGFITYREGGDFEAIKYDGETFTFKNTIDELQRVKPGDWIVKSTDLGLYFVVKAADFNNAFQKV
jgi:hypothetical protein